MIRRAGYSLLVLLAGAAVGGPAAAQPRVGPPIKGPVEPSGPGLWAPGPGPRPIRPVFILPGAPKLDRNGDPLPSGAVARFGSVRLRHGADVRGLGFTPDGKFLCTVSASEDGIKLWDATTGKEAARLPAAAHLVGLAADGSVFAVDDARVRVWLPAAKTVRALPDTTVPEGAAPTALAVNPDARSFALAADNRVLVIDATSGKTLRELNLPGAPANNGNGGKFGLVPPGLPGAPAAPPLPSPTKLVYSPDGRWLAGNGQNTGVWLWDLRTGKRVRTYRSEIDFPEYAFSPDVTKLVVTGERLHLYSLDSEEPVEGFKGPEGVIVFTPRYGADGKTLFVFQQDASVLPLDAATGEGKEALAAPETGLRPPFALAPGGANVAAIDPSNGIRVWDPKTGKGPEVARLPMLTHPGLSADGKSVTVFDQSNRVRAFDLATGAPGKVIELPVEDSGLPTGWDANSRRAVAVVPSGEELEVHVTDADSGKIVSRHQVPQSAGVPVVSFATANRDRMALLGQTGVIVVNPTTGKTVRSFQPGNAGNGVHGAISPDGRLVAVQTEPLTVWEVATGRKRLTVDAVRHANTVVFGPGSRLLVAYDDTATLVVVDVRTGAVTRRLQSPELPDGIGAIAVGADGKRLAVGLATGRVIVWDLTSGDTLAPFAGHDGMVAGLVFTAAGKKLVSTSQDGTALVWEVPNEPVATGTVDAAVSGFDEAFRLLGSADAAFAQRGLDYLYRHPAEAAKQAGERIAVPAATPAAKLARYVEDLGSEEFAVREAARKALEKLGGEASVVLKAAVEKSPSAEVRKVAGELLGKIDAPAARAEDLRVLRAVEAIENLRSPEGRALLEKWAAGPVGHRLTAEAAAALARLKALGAK